MIPATTAEAALEMDLLLLVHLCGAAMRVRRQQGRAGGEAEKPAGWQTRPDGSKVKNITGMEDLYGVLSGKL